MDTYELDFPPLSGSYSVLLVGHSFVKRLAQYARDRGCPNMALDPAQYHLSYLSKGGMKLSHLLAQVEDIRHRRPDVIFLEIGTNDLASGTDPQTLALEVRRFSVYLLNQLHVRAVCVSQITFRKAGTPKTPDNFNSQVTKYNSALFNLAKEVKGLWFWRHRSLWSRWEDCLSDGVHFNDLGNRRYYNSVRGAIVAATNKL